MHCRVLESKTGHRPALDLVQHVKPRPFSNSDGLNPQELAYTAYSSTEGEYLGLAIGIMLQQLAAFPIHVLSAAHPIPIASFAFNKPLSLDRLSAKPDLHVVHPAPFPEDPTLLRGSHGPMRFGPRAFSLPSLQCDAVQLGRAVQTMAKQNGCINLLSSWQLYSPVH